MTENTQRGKLSHREIDTIQSTSKLNQLETRISALNLKELQQKFDMLSQNSHTTAIIFGPGQYILPPFPPQLEKHRTSGTSITENQKEQMGKNRRTSRIQPWYLLQI